MTSAGTPRTRTSMPPTQEPYKLMRAKKGRMIGGVAAGLSQSSGLDVTVVRICIGATMLSGLGFAAYILMWIILPEESPKRGRVIEPAPESTARTIRITLFVLAALSALNKVGGFSLFDNGSRGGGFGGLLGLTLLGIGVAVLFSRHRPDRNWEPAQPPAPVSSWVPPRPADDDDPLAPHYFDDDEDPPTFAGPFGDVVGTVHGALSEAFSEVRTTLAESRTGRRADSASAYYVEDDEDDEFDVYDEDFTRPTATVTSNGLTRSGGAALGFARVIGWLAVIWFVFATIATAALWRFGSITVTAPMLLIVASSVVFFAVLNTLIYAKFARAVLPALALLLVPVAIGAASIRPIGPVGEQIVHPETLSGEKTVVYEHAVGALRINLGNTEFAGDTKINARNGTGAIFVTVPNDVAVHVTTDIGVGTYKLFGFDEKDFHVGNTDSHTFAGCEGAKRLTLNLRIGGGYAEVNRANGERVSTCRAA